MPNLDLSAALAVNFGNTDALAVRIANTDIWAKPADFPAPYAAYAFNEGSGSTITDYSGNGFHMTTHGSNTWVTGKGSYTYAFQSGGSGSDGAYYVAGGFISALSGDVTIQVNYKHMITADTISQAAGLYGSPGFTRGAIYSYRNRGGIASSPHVTARDSTGAVPDLGVNGTHTDSSWHNAAFVYHNSGLMELYFDGTLVESTTPSANSIGDTVQYIGVGSILSGNTSGEAAVQDFRVFASALTGAQIVTAMNTPVA
jgi:hypothetical protein